MLEDNDLRGPLPLAMELVRRWWQLELFVTDAQGQVPVLSPLPTAPLALPVVRSPQNDICRLTLQTKEGLRRCGASIAFAHERARAQPDTAITHQCHLGFLLVARSLDEQGGQEGSAVLCGLRDRPCAGLELESVQSRLQEMRPHSELPALSPLAAHAPEELEKASDFAHVLAELVLAHRQPSASAARPSRGPKKSLEPPMALIGQSLAMLELQRLIERVSSSDATVLVQGESGTGKELVARQIHERGARRDMPFVAQNCSALNDNLLESTLFGHVRGAFTGATRDTRGLFEQADGGTLFLDEIGDMSPALQVKLLRVLQEGTFTPVGGAEERYADVRIIAATHKDLAELVKSGSFREDLFYRVNVLRLSVPPLRAREDDVVLLAQHFLRRFSRSGATLTADVLNLFRSYSWPGNVRELQNEIQRMAVLGAGEHELGLALVSSRLFASQPPQTPLPESFSPDEALPTLDEAVENLERALFSESLRRNRGNKSQVARELGVSRSNLVLKLSRYGLG